MFKDTGFISKRRAEAISDPEGASRRAIISITSPDGTPGCRPAVLDQNSWSQVLRLQFHDLDPKVHGQVKSYVIFSEDQALQIIRFMRAHQDEHDVLIVHCEAGISRSAGVAKFVAYVYGLAFLESYSNYNRHVFNTLVRIYTQSMYGAGPLKPEELPGYTQETQSTKET